MNWPIIFDISVSQVLLLWLLVSRDMHMVTFCFRKSFTLLKNSQNRVKDKLKRQWAIIANSELLGIQQS